MQDLFAPLLKIDFALSSVLLVVSGLLLALSCYRIMRSYKLIDVVVLMSIFSLMIGVCYLLMDAPDVTMTEAALGSALSSCVMLNVIRYTGSDDLIVRRSRIIISSVLCLMVFVMLSMICIDLPDFADPESAMQLNVTKYYIEHTQVDIQIPSLVAAILASYRGFDTLGETLVILIAGLAVLIVTSRRKEL